MELRFHLFYAAKEVIIQGRGKVKFVVGLKELLNSAI